MIANKKSAKDASLVGLNLIPLIDKERIWTKDGISIIQRHQLTTIIRKRLHGKKIRSSATSRASFQNSLSHLLNLEQQVANLVKTLNETEDVKDGGISASNQTPVDKIALISPDDKKVSACYMNGSELKEEPVNDNDTETLEVVWVSAGDSETKRSPSDQKAFETSNNLSKSVAVSILPGCCKEEISYGKERILSDNDSLPDLLSIPQPDSPRPGTSTDIEHAIEHPRSADVITSADRSCDSSQIFRDTNLDDIEDTFIYTDCMTAHGRTFRKTADKCLSGLSRAISEPRKSYGSTGRQCPPLAGRRSTPKIPDDNPGTSSNDDCGERMPAQGAREATNESSERSMTTKDKRESVSEIKQSPVIGKKVTETLREHPGKQDATKDRIMESFNKYVDRQKRAQERTKKADHCSSEELIKARNGHRGSCLPSCHKRAQPLATQKSISDQDLAIEQGKKGEQAGSPSRIKDSYRVFIARHKVARKQKLPPQDGDRRFNF